MTESNSRAAAGSFDQPLHAAIAGLTSGISPISVNLAYADWLQHLALSPDKQLELFLQGMKNWQTLFALSGQPALGATAAAAIEPLPQDKRFADPAWRTWPFNLFSQSFLLTERWWQQPTTGLPGVARHHEDVVSFITRQMLDATAPTNFPSTRSCWNARLARGARIWCAARSMPCKTRSAPPPVRRPSAARRLSPAETSQSHPGKSSSATGSSRSSSTRRLPRKSIPSRF
jgi:hypothetical protein